MQKKHSTEQKRWKPHFQKQKRHRNQILTGWEGSSCFKLISLNTVKRLVNYRLLPSGMMLSVVQALEQLTTLAGCSFLEPISCGGDTMRVREAALGISLYSRVIQSICEDLSHVAVRPKTEASTLQGMLFIGDSQIQGCGAGGPVDPGMWSEGGCLYQLG